MKKVLISMMLVILTLCLFVSCSDEPKKDEPKVITFTLKDYGDRGVYLWTIPKKYENSKWEDLKDIEIRLGTYSFTVKTDDDYIKFNGGTTIPYKEETKIDGNKLLKNDMVSNTIHIWIYDNN